MVKSEFNAHIIVIERQGETMENTTENMVEKNKAITICRRCGRRLKDPKSIELGFGITCYKKHLAEIPQKRLFNLLNHK